MRTGPRNQVPYLFYFQKDSAMKLTVNLVVYMLFFIGVQSIGSLGKDNSTAIVSKIVLDTAFLKETTNGLRIKTWQVTLPSTFVKLSPILSLIGINCRLKV